jgi:hypothetical protein
LLLLFAVVVVVVWLFFVTFVRSFAVVRSVVRLLFVVRSFGYTTRLVSFRFALFVVCYVCRSERSFAFDLPGSFVVHVFTFVSRLLFPVCYHRTLLLLLYR